MAHGRPGERYVLSGFTLSTSAAVKLLEEVTGLTFNLRLVPIGVVKGVAGIIGAGSRLFGRHPRFCREMARVLAVKIAEMLIVVIVSGAKSSSTGMCRLRTRGCNLATQ